MKYKLSLASASVMLAIISSGARAADETDAIIGRFEITRFQVDGNSILRPTDIQVLLSPFTGKNRNFQSIRMAQEALEAAYRKRGYNLVRVALPEQELNQGVVRFAIVETRIDKIIVEGNTLFSEANVRRSLPSLKEGQSPDIARVSSDLRLANENPAKKTSLKIQSAAKDDEVNALLTVTDEKPWRAGINLDNSGDSSTGKSHIGALYQNANVTGRDDVLSLQYTTTIEHPSKVGVYGAGYHLPLYAFGDSIDLFGSYSSVDSGTVSAGIFDLQVNGKGTVLGARYNFNLPRQADFESKIIFGLDYKAFVNNVTIGGAPVGNDITVHPVSIGYSGALNQPFGDLNFFVTASHNIPGGDKGNNTAFARVRTDARASYTAIRYGANFSKAFDADWQFRLAMNGQASSDALVPGEQFGAGGANSVRGYAEREIAGDAGHFVSAEIYSPNLCGKLGMTDSQCRVLAFYDTASVTRKNPLAGEPGDQTIASGGIGFRLSVSKNLSLQMDVGNVLKAIGTTKKGDKRLHFSMGLSY